MKIEDMDSAEIRALVEHGRATIKQYKNKAGRDKVKKGIEMLETELTIRLHKAING